jgi:hypothetical protein
VVFVLDAIGQYICVETHGERWSSEMENIGNVCERLFQSCAGMGIEGPFLEMDQITLRLMITQFEDQFFECGEDKATLIGLITESLVDPGRFGIIMLFPEIAGLHSAEDIMDIFNVLSVCPLTLASFMIVQARSNKMSSSKFIHSLENIYNCVNDEFEDTLYVIARQKDFTLHRYTPYKCNENGKFIRSGLTISRDSIENDIPTTYFISIPARN